MLIYFLIYVIICLYGVKIIGNKNSSEYISVEKTQSIKGIFILMVFFSHFNSYVVFDNPFDLKYKEIFGFFGQTMVTLFMFYSGYGVMESIKKKGMPYVDQMPVRRILGTLFKFDIAVVIYAVISILFGGTITGKQFLLSLVAWDSVGNSNWYIFAILALYIFTYIAFKICAGKCGNYIPAILVLIFTCAYIVGFVKFNLKAVWWYDTVMCYVFGMFYSLFHVEIEKRVNKNLICYIIALAACVAVTAYFKTHSGLKMYLLLMLSFTGTVIVFSMRIALDNKILRWCGKHLFEIYIMQRIPMIVFKEMGVLEFNMYVYFILCLTATVGISVVFEKFCGNIWNYTREKLENLISKKKEV